MPDATDIAASVRQPPSSPSEISCQAVSVTFASGTTAVDDVSLQLEAGKIHSLIGASGCGKTTLLRSIAGLQACTKGRIELSPPAISERGEIGFVFQQPSLLPWLTTVENVMLPLELLGAYSRDERRKRATEILHSVRLADAADRMPNQLSGGMKMRVSIARALITRPSVLLLDEPFAALDDLLREQLGQLLRSLWNQYQFTAVLVTHNIAESILLSHQIVLMHDGKVQQIITNSLPEPRVRSIRTSPEFGRFYGQVSDQLRATADWESSDLDSNARNNGPQDNDELNNTGETFQ
ncbi:ABC transporter ATP-binding protein [Planctomycetes bacterium K23_9]|uniref:Bicarbonate transport ATP-binding protein CmpD n=1 Tax=Stieleria marina TaxID=1930275 RepID=A0A517NQY8_9BACT|nr:Bicarbonate transport ATP-binding protein CmpD [Planctomycetes bacterium K23_9]